MATIALDDVTKHWGSHTAVNKLNLSIESGEFVVLVGPSGCGKSTTLRMIAGLEPLSSGEIRIDGNGIDHLQPAERDIAMVFQDYGLYPSLSVYENIRFPLKVRKVPKHEQHERVQQAASRVQLTELLDRRPSQLSGGQQQRVALARAMIRKPSIFLMDEPLSSLDAQLRLSMRAEIRNLQHQLGTTTLYVTHDQQEAMTLADRVVVLNNGVIQQADTPDVVYKRPSNTFVAGFIGSPPMNLVDGHISRGIFAGSGIRVNGLPVDCEGDVTLGFRASSIQCGVRYNTTASVSVNAPIYAIENLGETTQLTVKVDTDNPEQSTDLTIRATVSNLSTTLQSARIGDRLALRIDGPDCLLYARPGGHLIQ